MVKDMLKSKVLLVPGHKSELFCIAAEEARELCIPIITLGIGSLSERVEHGVTGYIAKNKDLCQLKWERGKRRAKRSRIGVLLK